MICSNLVDKQPSRKKIFSEVRSSEDIQIWTIDVQGKSIRCAKVSNPEVLTKSGSDTPKWTELAGVQRLEIEDPEATLYTIPKHLFTELQHLESLSVTWTKIKSLPSELFRLPLNSLYLQRNHIKTLNGIEKAAQLTILDISNNNLDSLPKTFGQLQNLVTLNLSGNGLHELPESIGSLTRLKTLDCSCNKLRSLPNSLGNIIELTSLDVSTNHLSRLPESLGSLPKLEDLRARSNQLTSLPDSFGQLTRLNSLLLRNNRFGDIPAQLEHLTNLQSLNMRENMITHMDKPIFPLKYLILDKNYLKQIDAGILQCHNLQYLSLKSNSLDEVTASISELANIRTLDLSDNAIAEIPTGLDRLTHLHHLSLCSTKVRTIPLAVASMESLCTLELEDCTELDGYLSIAYKTDGLPGVVEYLMKIENEKPVSKPPSTQSDVKREKSRKDKDKLVSMYPNELVPQDEVGRKLSLRNAAGLSIMPGTTVSPPAPEAMLQVETNRSAPPKLVHVARQSLCPSEPPAKPYKPPNLSATHQDQNRRGRASQLQAVAESPTGHRDSDVVATMPHFGDLTSFSTTETSPRRDAAALRTNEESNPLLTGNTSTAGASGTHVAKPGPPVKKKPTRIVP